MIENENGGRQCLVFSINAHASQDGTMNSFQLNDGSDTIPNFNFYIEMRIQIIHRGHIIHINSDQSHRSEMQSQFLNAWINKLAYVQRTAASNAATYNRACITALIKLHFDLCWMGSECRDYWIGGVGWCADEWVWGWALFICANNAIVDWVKGVERCGNENNITIDISSFHSPIRGGTFSIRRGESIYTETIRV